MSQQGKALVQAAKDGNANEVSRLLKLSNVDKNYKDENGWTVLTWAAYYGQAEIMKVLLKAGACANLQTKEGNTALIWTAWQGHLEAAKALLQAGANVNVQNKNGWTALIWAASINHLEIVKALLQTEGVDMNLQDRDGYAALLFAAEGGHLEVMTALLQAGADVNLQKKNGKTALDLAKTEEIKQLLRFPPPPVPTGAGTGADVGSFANSTSSGSLSKNSASSGNKRKFSSSDVASNSAMWDETAAIALKKILDQEKAARKQLEIQNTQLLQEFTFLTQQLAEAQNESIQLEQQLSESQDESDQLEQQVSQLLGQPAALESATIEECDELEKALKTSLERVEAKKALLIRNKMEDQQEQRMCVVCQEAEKSVVLLPCRHLCLCAACSTHDLLTMCPLCRVKIVDKIGVFS